ncbi:MAG: hypothetical protein CL521_00420, partial [Actinobacteria bacterium]|nr:hypothetical protein [Actinomycetota bacterium]
MHLLIDGYNLIGQMGLWPLSDPEKEDKLCQYLSQIPLRPRDQITVIFDGKRQDALWPEKSTHGQIQFIFTVNPD